jgi:alkylation response protein AidB-like acyl-CoA dehydrogenase
VTTAPANGRRRAPARSVPSFPGLPEGPAEEGIPVNFAFSDEQDQLRDAVRKFLESKSPESEVRRLMETTEGYDPAVWSQMANELGLQGLHIPEEYGGQGFTWVELGIVLEEMGRALLCAPYFSTVVLAADAILNAGTDDQKSSLLPGIASGETIATLAFTEPNGKWDATGITLEASGPGDTATLTGTKMFVLDGHTADLIVVVARAAGTSGEDGISFYTVAGDAKGLTRTALATMDQTRKQAKLEFDGVEAQLLGALGSGWTALSKTLDQAAVGLCNEMVGGGQFVLDESVQYAKDRVQFGRPIGSFQAIKHKCADMLLEIESAKSAAYYAAWAAAEDNDELPVVASLAKAYCSDAYFHAAAENIQIHGGIGFTWEHNAHLYFKRAKSSEILLGDATYHRELLAQRIGI